MKLGLGLSLTGMQRRRDAPASVIASIFSDSEGFTTPLTLDQYFSDTAGTTAAVDTGPIALALDKSRGIPKPPLLFIPLDGFASIVGWNAENAALAIVDGALRVTNTASSAGVAWRQLPSGIGKNIQLLVTGRNFSGVTPNIRAGNFPGSNFANANGNATLLLTQSWAGDFFLTLRVASGAINAAVEFRSVSIREFPGNHLTQTSATFRPTLNAGGILFDGGDDRLASPYVSGNAGSLFARFNGATASRVLLGAQPATDGRAFLALDASGRIAAGIGEQSTGVIRDQEADRRNLLAFTEDFGSGAWTTISGGTVPTPVKTPNFGTAPDGTQTACRLQITANGATAGGDFGLLRQILSGQPSELLFSNPVYIKSNTGLNQFVTLRYNANTAGVVEVTSDWQRLSVTNGSGTPAFDVGIRGNTLAKNDVDVLIWHPHAEIGSDPGEYQPILGATLNDLRNAWHTAGVTWDGATAKLYLDGAEVYSEPQVGAVSGSVPAMLGALNANGTAAAFWNGRISNALAVDRPLTPAEITKLTNKWSA